MIWPARICVIEVAPTEIRAVLARQRGGSCKVLKLAQSPIEPIEDEDPRESAIRALETLLDDTDLAADVYVGCLPANVAIVRPLTIPFVGARRVGAAVKYEMEPVVPFPIDELVVDYVPVRQDGKKATDVVAVGLRAETARYHLEVLEGAGLDPDCLSLDVAGLTNLWSTSLTSEDGRKDGVSLVMHACKDCSYFVAMDAGVPAFFRAMNFGAGDLREGRVMAMEEVLATIRSIMTTFTRDSFSELFVTGVDLDDDVRDKLADRLSLPVRCMRLSKNSPFFGWHKKIETVDEPADNVWEPLVGLAADGGQKGWMRLNFRKEELKQVLATPEVRRRAMFSGVLVAVLVVVGVMGLNLRLHELRAEDVQLGDAIYEKYLETVPNGNLPREYDVLAVMKKEIEQQSTDRIVEPFLGKSVPAISVLSAVSGCVPPGDAVDVTRLEMLFGGKVRISGLTTDPSLPGKMKEGLAALDSLANVDIERRKDVEKNGVKKVEFSIVGAMKGSG